MTNLRPGLFGGRSPWTAPGPPTRPLRLLYLLCVSVATLTATILPERLAEFTRGEEKPVPLTDKALWDEFGYDDAAQAEYAGAGRHFTLSVVRLKDSTGAMAAFRWQRPAGARPSKFDKLAVETSPTTLLCAFGNYLFQYDGRQPTVREFEELLAKLPKLEKASLPILPGYLPAKTLIPNSDRYILGPAALEKFAPAIPPGAAGFSTGAEGAMGKFASPSGEIGMVLFSYPTPHIARERLVEFQKIQGAVVKRTGPIVAVVLPPANADAAERLLADVRYAASITLNQKVPGKGEDAGSLMVGIFTLAGILMLLAIVMGIAVGGFRILWQKISGHAIAQDSLIVLHLSDR